MKRTITHLGPFLRQAKQFSASIVAVVVMLGLVACGPSDPLQGVRKSVAAGQFADSLDPLRELIEEDGDNPQLLFLYGRALFETGQPGLAVWPLRKIMELPEWFERAALLVAKIEIAGGNLENAAEIYADVLEKNPDDMATRLARANVCARSPRMTEEALAEVDRILEIDPDELGAFKPRILAHLSMDNVDEARQGLEELGARIEGQQVENEPIKGWHCATMAIFASDSGDEALAAELWAGCEENFPAHENVVYESIEFHKTRDELPRALEVAEAALATESEGFSAYRLVVADLLRQNGRPAEAEALLTAALETEDVIQKSGTLLALTEHYKAVGDLESAAGSLERALAILQNTGPQPDLLFALADIFIQIDEDERALALTRQMTVAAHRALISARVSHKSKQYVKALNFYDEATRLWPENPFAPYYAGLAAMGAGQFDRAFRSFLLAIRIQDAATDSRFLAARLMAAEGRIGTAVELLSTGRVGVSTDGQLLLAEIMAAAKGSELGIQQANLISQKHPELFGEAIAAVAKGTRRRSLEAAWEAVEPYLSQPFPPINHLPILRAAVDVAPREKQLKVLEPYVAKAVESAERGENAGSAYEIEGMYFEREGKLDEAEASYRRSIEVRPNDAATLFRLAQVTASESPQGAIVLVERGLAQPEIHGKRFEAGLFLSAVSDLEDSPEVEQLLETALEHAPQSGQIAMRLASLLEANDREAGQIVALANRAIRFQVGEEAVAIRERAQARL
jgi:tetratricopeptide (TPR) repeat protein